MSLDSHKWTSLPSIPRPRLYFTTTIVDDKLFLLGGCQQRGEAQPTVDLYDFTTEKWRSVADLPEPKAAPSVVRIDDKLFSFGGVGRDAKATAGAEYLDLGAECWVGLKALPEKLQGIAVQRRGDKIILVGGMTPEMVGSTLFHCFDPSRATIQALPAMPTRRSKAGAFLINDKLYVLGGSDGRTPVSVLEMFDFRAFKWTTLAQRSSPPRIFETIVSLGDSRLACLGGLQTSFQGFSDAVDVFNLATETWSVAEKMPEPRGDFACGWFQEQLVAAGGFGNGGRPLNSVCAYDPEKDKWTALPSMKEAHASCGYAFDQTRLIVAGGMSVDSGYSSCVEIFKLQ